MKNVVQKLTRTSSEDKIRDLVTQALNTIFPAEGVFCLEPWQELTYRLATMINPNAMRSEAGQKIMKIFGELVVEHALRRNCAHFLVSIDSGMPKLKRKQESFPSDDAFIEYWEKEMMVRTYAMGALIDFMCSSLDNAIRWALLLLGALQQASITRATSGMDETSEVYTSGPAFEAIGWIVKALTSQPLMPEHKWFELLLEYSGQPLVSEILESLCSYLGWHGDVNKPLIGRLPTDADAGKGGMTLLPKALSNEGVDTSRSYKITLSPTGIRLYQAWRGRQAEARALRGKRVQLELAEIQRHEPMDVRQRYQEIAGDIRQGLRPAGFDFIEVNLEVLREAGVTGLIFWPKSDQPLPACDIELVLRKETPHLITVRISLEENMDVPALLRSFRAAMYGHTNLEQRAALLFEVILDCLRKLTSGYAFKEPKHPSFRRRNTSERAKTPTRPHFMSLAEGRQRTAEAEQYARMIAGTLPPAGKTFRRATLEEGGRGIVYDIPSEPFATYTVSDLMAKTMAKTR